MCNLYFHLLFAVTTKFLVVFFKLVSGLRFTSIFVCGHMEDVQSENSDFFRSIHISGCFTDFQLTL